MVFWVFFQEASPPPHSFLAQAREIVFNIHLSCFPRPCLWHTVLPKWLFITNWSHWTQLSAHFSMISSLKSLSFLCVTLDPPLWRSMLGTSCAFSVSALWATMVFQMYRMGTHHGRLEPGCEPSSCGCSQGLRCLMWLWIDGGGWARVWQVWVRRE